MTSDETPRSADLALITGLGPETFPFRRQLSLRPLIDFWRGDGTGCDGGEVCSSLAKVVQDAVAGAPELLEPIDDLGVLKKHEDVLDALMAAVFPPAAWDQSYGAALMPFDLVSVYETPGFQQALLTDDRRLRGHVNLDPENLKRARMRFAYKVVLERVYGVKIEIDYPLI